MMRIFVSILSLFVLASSFSCWKEKSFENPKAAEGSLKSELTGDCFPKILGGTYTAGKSLGDTNFIELEIDVTATGAYKITTDTVNGYSFRATGNFSTTGINKVKLKGTGIPLTGGTDNFTVRFGSGICSVQVPVLSSANTGSPAAFTLQGTAGSCINASVSGNYIKGTALNASNKAVIEVNVTAIGNYTISTVATNGMSFSGSGSFTATGVQKVTLVGTGAPVNTGAITIPVTAGGSSCGFVVNVSNASAGATGTLGGAPGACTTSTVNGTYTQGTGLTTSHTVQVQVNVTTPGAYSITTNTINGFSFSKSGTFTAAGVQNVVLEATGTPSAAGTTSFSVTFGSSTCTFQVTVAGGTTTPPPTGAYFWKFTSGNFTYQGSVDVADANYVNTGIISAFNFFGETLTGDTLINIALADISGGIKANETYSTNAATTNGAGFQVHSSGVTLFEASSSTPGTNMTIKVTSHNTTTKIIEGTFIGTAKDGAGATKTIANGQFKVQYQ